MTERWRHLRLAAVLHVITLAVLAALPLAVPDLGGIYWLALAAIAALLVWEHAIVRPDDLSRVVTPVLRPMRRWGWCSWRPSPSIYGSESAARLRRRRVCGFFCTLRKERLEVP